MAQVEQSATWKSFVYSPSGQRQVLLGLLSLGILIPVVFNQYLSPIIILFPFVLVGGVLLVRKGRPKSIPTWVTFNAVSFFLLVYGAHRIGSVLSLNHLLLFLVAMLAYDLIGVRTGKMQSMNKSMLTLSVPIVLLLPHSPAFSYDSFKEIINEEGLEGLHGSDHGVMMLGIGDAVLPGALAIGASGFGTAYSLGLTTITTTQVTTILGGIVGLSILIWAELPRPIAALTVSVPGSLLGFALGVLIDPAAGLPIV